MGTTNTDVVYDRVYSKIRMKDEESLQKELVASHGMMTLSLLAC